jgi:predicted deacetylase
VVTPAIAVALHDVEPATFARCLRIRALLAERGVDRVTLLVIPATAGHPFGERSPELHAWLIERRSRGDAVAQHGYVHRRRRAAGPVRRWQGGCSAEFGGLRAAEARTRLREGRRLLERAGLAPRGFVAPGYAYTPALRRELRAGYAWFATLARCWSAGSGWQVAPALGLGLSSATKRALSPALMRAAPPFAGQTLRLDVHPGDFDAAGHLLALEHVLGHAAERRPITYDQLLAG